MSIALEKTVPTAQRAVANRFGEMLRCYVGRGRLFTPQAFAEATGLDRRTLNGYRYGEMAPSLAGALVILSVLPAEASDMVLSLAGLSGAERVVPEEVDEIGTLKDLMEAGYTLTDALDRGRVDHRKRTIVVEKLRRLARRVGYFVRGLECRA